MKIGWEICQKKASIWTDWCYNVFLKENSFWAAKVNYNCSCSWRNVLKARNLLANYLHYEIGDGVSISLWFDPWLSGVSLVDRYGDSVIQDSGLQRNARLSSVIKEGEWDWPVTFPDLIDISNLTSGLSLSNTTDRIHWMKKGGTSTIREACNVINMQGREVEWWKIAWFPSSIPKHSFCVWLTFWEAHRTLDKLVRWGVVSSSNCCFSCGQEESIDHLFFSCPFTARVWNHFLGLCGFRRRSRGWREESVWCISRLKGNGFKMWITKLTLAAVIYHCWQERNNRLFNNCFHNFEFLVKCIEEDVGGKCSGLSKVEDNPINRDIFSNWNFSPSSLTVRPPQRRAVIPGNVGGQTR
ncbi:zf-RVT domain-containing protein [Cephalotus follicularis]|uniref:Zf-RVT domain-containing protein n=1 Tax=Cephalotus follicularis TaxID=3775 RepID=A0A1Q3CK31_CEPFO|nr:zf-RVT domain-containing protein [Cephalotus follicularis]